MTYINCTNCAHCVDIAVPDTWDAEELKQARLNAFKTIGGWLDEDKKSKDIKVRLNSINLNENKRASYINQEVQLLKEVDVNTNNSSSFKMIFAVSIITIPIIGFVIYQIGYKKVKKTSYNEILI